MGISLQARQAIRPDPQDNQNRHVLLQQVRQPGKQLPRLVRGIRRKQFLPLIDHQDDGRCAGRLAIPVRDIRLGHGRQQRREPPFRQPRPERATASWEVVQSEIGDDRGIGKPCLQRLIQAAVAGQNRPARADHGQRYEVPVVPLETRPQTRPQEGRLARARCAQHDHHAFDALVPQVSEPVERADNMPFAPEEYRRILFGQRRQTRIGTCSDRMEHA